MDPEDDTGSDDDAAFIWLQAAVQDILSTNEPAPRPQDSGTIPIGPEDDL